jgi:hypothetical protein
MANGETMPRSVMLGAKSRRVAKNEPRKAPAERLSNERALTDMIGPATKGVTAMMTAAINVMFVSVLLFGWRSA